jgi:hypothetical protein
MPSPGIIRYSTASELRGSAGPKMVQRLKMPLVLARFSTGKGKLFAGALTRGTLCRCCLCGSCRLFEARHVSACRWNSS